MSQQNIYSKEKVDAAARGRWLDILANLGGLSEAVQAGSKKKVDCPMKGNHSKGGGKKDFRLFKDAPETGGAICTCGKYPNGYLLLQAVNGWDFKTTLASIGVFLGVPPEETRPDGYLLYFKGVISDPHWCGDKFVLTITSETGTVNTVTGDQSLEAALKTIPQGVVTAIGKKKGKPWGVSVGITQVAEIARIKPADTSVYRKAGVDPELLRKKYGKIWEEAMPLNDPRAAPALRYLSARKIGFRRVGDKLRSGSVRYHPSLAYYDEDGKFAGKHPAIVCKVEKAGRAITLHRIYLTVDGRKAEVADPKKMAAVPDDESVTGGAIKMMAPFKGVIGIAEGLETAFAVTSATGCPMWSAVNATLLENLEIGEEDGIDTVLIFEDKDKSKAGAIAGSGLENKLLKQGINVLRFAPTIDIPDGDKGIDWDDVNRKLGASGFPDLHLQASKIQHLSAVG